MRRVAILCALAACGRLGFDERVPGTNDGAVRDGTIGDGGGGGGDGADGSGSASAALVQMSAVAMGAGTMTVTLPAPSQAGTVLVATLAVNSTASLAYPSGWQQDEIGTINGACNSIIATNSTGMAGVTSVQFQLLAGVPYGVQITEWRVGAVDAAGFGGGMNPTTSLAISTQNAATLANEIDIATFCADTTMPTFTPGAGWNVLGAESNVASSPSLFAEYRSDLPAGTLTATATSSLSAKYAAAVVTFLP